MAVRSVVAMLLTAMAAVPATSHATTTTEPIEFQVENPLEPGVTYTVHGTRFLPANPCSATVLLLQHGLSYGEWGWDFGTVNGVRYSVARSLAEAGYPAVAIDRLGYGASEHPNGRLLTVEGYAAMTDQMARTLRDAYGYQRVGLVGHSAGTEVSEFAQAVYGSGDLLIATGYHHFPSDRIVADFVTGDSVRALTHDGEYFGADPDQRAEYMYHLPAADPDVVALDTARAHWTPSGEVHTIGIQPSRYVVGAIDVPVLNIFGEHDLLFPPGANGPGRERMDAERALFASTPDYTDWVMPDAGHSMFLHPNTAALDTVLAFWLAEHAPSCA